MSYSISVPPSEPSTTPVWPFFLASDKSAAPGISLYSAESRMLLKILSYMATALPYQPRMSGLERS